MTMTTTHTVVGMTCDHCVRSVRAEVEKIAGVTAAAVDLASGAVTVESNEPIPEEAVAAAVEEAGYEMAP